eukprot:CAMPEP_0202973040 /NCGR_PEP_ID=MMETSP1396-20130829/45505_1 /ASSEMBLY_ACC=CAM_ASM_000872 /TAXON_ID= /ORGANISM="Pseudokeronopsis sp., Strain Brazil" /LENGTH=31 /DNA_ID= /DNA_START= /DNA_END= /DNA_ORIENTATION=
MRYTQPRTEKKNATIEAMESDYNEMNKWMEN